MSGENELGAVSDEAMGIVHDYDDHGDMGKIGRAIDAHTAKAVENDRAAHLRRIERQRVRSVELGSKSNFDFAVNSVHVFVERELEVERTKVVVEQYLNAQWQRRVRESESKVAELEVNLQLTAQKSWSIEKERDELKAQNAKLVEHLAELIQQAEVCDVLGHHRFVAKEFIEALAPTEGEDGKECGESK